MPADRPEELLAHADFVRDLAHHLLWDPDAADDVAQQAWVAAVERPPRDAARARGWFAAVVANLARKRWRGEARRRAREQGAARPERTISTDELVAAEEVRRRVVEAVLALDEPYRTAVVLRFYDEQPPRAIADRLGVPVDTVKTRLKRGLARLRERLDAAHGGRRAAWALALLPLAGLPAEAAAVGTGGLALAGGLMATKAKLGIAAAAFALGAVVGTVGVAPLLGGVAPGAAARADRPPLETAQGPATPAAGPGVERLADSGLAAPAAGPAAPAADVLPATAYDPRLGIVLVGAVQDAARTPVDGARVWVHGPNGARDMARGSRFAFAGLAAGDWELMVRAPGFREVVTQVALSTDRAFHRHDITMERSVVLSVRFRTAAGEEVWPTVDKRLAAERVHLFESALTAVATAAHPGTALPLTPNRDHSRYGVGEWRVRGEDNPAAHFDVPEGFDGVLDIAASLPVHVSAVVRHVVLATRWVEPGTSEVTFELTPEQVLGAFGTVRVRFVAAESDHPIASAGVNLANVQGGGGGSAAADADGVAELRLQPPGLLKCSIRAEGREQIEHFINVLSGEVTDLGTIRLRAGYKVSGRVSGADGKPVECMLSLDILDRLPFPQELDTGSYFATEDGSFRVTGVPEGRVAIRVRPVRDPLATVVVPVDTAGGDVEGLEVKLDPGVLVTLPSTVAATESRVVWIVDAQGFPVYTDYVHGPYERQTRLAPGRYRLLIHDPDGRLRSETPVTVGDGPTTIPIGPG